MASEIYTNAFIIQQETKYYNPKEVASLWMLKTLIVQLDKEIMSGNLPYDLTKFKCELREKMRAAIKFYLQKIKEGKLSLQDYEQNIKNTMKFFLLQKQEQEKSGKPANRYDKQVMLKFQALKKELQMMTEQKEKAFNKIQQLAAINIDETIYDKSNLDKKPFNEKIKLFATRYKQYRNMITYLAKNMKESRQQQLTTQLLPLLQKANDILVKLGKGEQVSINQILTQEMYPITREQFLGMSDEVFNDKLKKLMLLIADCIEKEKKFKQFARSAKKTKESNWPVYSEFKIKLYQQLMNNLNTINDGLKPLPIIEVKEEKRNLILEDKDVDFQDMIVSIQKITGCPKGRYKLNFSFELNKTIVSESLDFCDENTQEWNFVKKYSRGPDIKKLDNDIHNKTINVNIFKKGFFGQDEFGRVSIPLTDLATKSSISSTINVQHKKETFQLHVRILFIQNEE